MTSPGSGKAVVMVGTSLEGRGGMSSVTSSYRDAGLFERCGVVYLASHVEGGKLDKLRAMLGSLLQLWGLLLAGRVRLVHIHTASGVSFWRKSAFAWSTLLARRPLLVHVHGGEFDLYHAKAPRWSQAHTRALLARADRVIVLSEVWIERLRPICPEARWVALANPVSVRPAPDRSASADGLLRVLFLGRYIEAKGVFDLLRAFGQVQAELPTLRLLLGGEGDREALMRVAREVGVADKVELLGWVVGAAKDDWLDRCDIFALPSWFEGLPVSMLEAMAAGQAVLVSNVGSIPEVIRHGENGWLVPPRQPAALAQALRMLGSDAALRQRLGAQARADVCRDCARETVCRRLEALYETVAP
jgi:glycosyltransferase involved in cell wall biosynthesis